jgi:hypothetical protein
MSGVLRQVAIKVTCLNYKAIPDTLCIDEGRTQRKSADGEAGCGCVKGDSMPYIPENRREFFDNLLRQCAGHVQNEGELNYCFYKLATLLIEKTGESYANLSMCSSAMEHAKLEWYRKRLAPYEDRKIAEHGDI